MPQTVDGTIAPRTRRSVQAGVYPNVMVAAKNIVAAAGARGLFTGYLPTLLEDIPDMAFKFAAYESLRAAHLRLMCGRKASVQVRCSTICFQGCIAKCGSNHPPGICP